MSIDSVISETVSFLTHNYKPILASIAAVWSFKQLSVLSQEHHTMHYELTHEERTSPIDAQLFPQYFKNAGGLHLFTRRWLVPEPKALIFLVHGFQEHISRYEHVALYLNSQGFSVVGIDHQGHGCSDGDALHVNSFSHFVEDYIAFAEREQAWAHAKAGPYGPNPLPPQHHGHRPRSSSSASSYLPAPAGAHSALPMVLMGHSMGGLIAALVAQHSHAHPALAPWRALVLSSPCMDIDPALKSPVMIFFSTFLSKSLPKLVVASLPTGAISSLAAVCDRYDRDVVMKGRTFVRARMGYEMLEATKRVQRRAPELTLPIFAMHSPADRLVTFAGTEAFMEAAGSSDKTFERLDEMGHEALNDWDRERLLQLVARWIDSKVKAE